MSYDLRITSPRGERKEGKFLFKIAQGGGYMEVEDKAGRVAISKFIVRLEERKAHLVPVAIQSILSSIDEQPPDWPELPNLHLADIPEYPQATWCGEGVDDWGDVIYWGIHFSYRAVAISVAPVVEECKDREHIAGLDVSWGTSEEEYRHVLQGLVDICTELGLEVYDPQGFGTITEANLDAAVQAFVRPSTVARRVLGVTKDVKAHDGDEVETRPDDTNSLCDNCQDEDTQQKCHSLIQTPVYDCELSIRARNSLQKMGVMILADLCRCTEQELLAGDRISAVHLAEIKAMLGSKNLHLGRLPCARRPDNTRDVDA